MDDHTHDDPDTITCESCGEKIRLTSSLENPCRGCSALYNGFGQRLRESRRSQLAQERGRDPGVGRTRR